MGNSKSKKTHEKPNIKATVFDRERHNEHLRTEKSKQNANPTNKRVATKEPPVIAPPLIAPVAIPSAPPANLRSFDDDAIERMRYQLRNDCDAFLLNNILLSVQFFENYER